MSLLPFDRPSDDQFQEVLERARAGCFQALGQILQSLRANLERHCPRIPIRLRPKADMADLVQETLCEGVHCFAQFRGNTKAELHVWLSSILHHKFLNFVRHYRAGGKSQPRHQVSLDDLVACSHVPAALATDIPGPYSAAVRAESDQLLARALDRLTVHYRTVLRLRFSEGRTWAEIGRFLHTSSDAARQCYYRALDTLREELSARLALRKQMLRWRGIRFTPP